MFKFLEKVCKRNHPRPCYFRKMAILGDVDIFVDVVCGHFQIRLIVLFISKINYCWGLYVVVWAVNKIKKIRNINLYT